MDIARYIDHTLLRADATPAEIARLCAEAKRFGFAAVCVNPWHVSRCARLLKRSGVKVCAVIGFPLGAVTPAAKAFEAAGAVMDGAGELDMVVNIGALKAGDTATVLRDIRAVRKAAGKSILKVILETSALTDAQKRTACRLARKAGADFVKTSTGFGSGGATARDVSLLKKAGGPGLSVKASGGIRSRKDVLRMLRAGATRIGTSNGAAIVTDKR